MGVSLTLQRVSPPSGSRQWVQGRCSRWRPWRGRSWWSPGAQAGEPGCSCWSTHTETCGTGGIRRPSALGSGDWEQKWGREVLGLSRDGSPLQVPPQAVSSWHWPVPGLSGMLSPPWLTYPQIPWDPAGRPGRAPRRRAGGTGAAAGAGAAGQPGTASAPAPRGHSTRSCRDAPGRASPHCRI